MKNNHKNQSKPLTDKVIKIKIIPQPKDNLSL